MSLLNCLARYGLLCLLIASTAVAQVERDHGPSTTDESRVSCVLRIDSDQNRGPRDFDSQTLCAMLTSTAMLDPVAEKISNLSPAEWKKCLQVETTPLGVNSARLTVALLPDATLKAGTTNDVLAALIQAARVSVGRIGQQHSQTAQNEAAGLEQRISEAKKVFRAASAAYEAGLHLSRTFAAESGEMATRNLSAERDNLVLTLAADRAKLKVLDEELQKLPRLPATKPANIGEQPSSPGLY